MDESCLAALVATDRRYFHSGAMVDRVAGATISWVPGFGHLPAGCVVHDVDIDRVTADPGRWLDTIRAAASERGATADRFYLDADGSLADRLRAHGLRERREVAWAAPLPELEHVHARRRDVVLRRLDPADDATWEIIADLHRVGGIGSGVHDAPPDEWTALMRRRCSDGSMIGHLVTAGDRPCGSVSTLRVGGMFRSKNIVVARSHRRQSIGRTVLSILSAEARALGCHAIGAFAVPGTDGAGLYPAAGMRAVGSQTEWSRPSTASKEVRS